MESGRPIPIYPSSSDQPTFHFFPSGKGSLQKDLFSGRYRKKERFNEPLRANNC